jgi:hypothetical protein
MSKVFGFGRDTILLIFAGLFFSPANAPAQDLGSGGGIFRLPGTMPKNSSPKPAKP